MAWSDNLPINSGYSWKEGTTTGSYDMNYVKTWMEWLVTDDQANNRSIINVKMYSQVITGGASSDMAKWTTAENFGYAGYDNSNRVYRSTTYDFNNFNRNCFADATFYVDHNADGTKSITLQTAFTTHSSTVTGGSVSENLTLTSYPRGTDLVSVTGKNYGYPSSFNLSRKSSSFRERVTMSYGGNNLPIKDTDNANVNFTYTLPRDYTPNTTKPSASTWTITVATYNGATLVETKTYTETWSIKEGDDANYAPVITANPSCTALNSGFTGAIPALTTDTCLAWYSKLRVSANKADITFQYGAGLPNDNNCRMVEFSLYGSVTGKDNTNYDTDIINTSGNCHWVYTVTDSRGFSSTKEGYFTVINYTTPDLYVFDCFRGNSGGTADDSGTYIWVKAREQHNSLNGHNNISVYKATVSGADTALTNDTLTAIKTDASPSTSYTVTFTVTDILKTTTITRSVPSEDLPINIRENGHGVGIGTAATVSGRLNIGYNTYAKDKNITYWNAAGNRYNQFSGTTIYSESYSPNSSTYSQDGNTRYSERASYKTTFDNVEFSSGHITKSQSAELWYDRLELTDDTTSPTKSSETRANYFRIKENSVEQARIDGGKIKIRDRIFGTCNLLDMAEQGEIDGSTGADTSVNSTVRLRSPFSSKLSPSTTYTISHSPSSVYVVKIFFYTITKAFISATYLDTPWTYSFTTPSNCYYVRFNFRKSDGSTIVPSDVSTLQLEDGSSASPYTPYAMDNVELTERLSYKKIYFTPSNSSADGDGCWYAKKGNWVHLHLAFRMPNQFALIGIGTLPSGYRPKNYVGASGVSVNDSATVIAPIGVLISPNGTINASPSMNYNYADIEFLAEQ